MPEAMLPTPLAVELSPDARLPTPVEVEAKPVAWLKAPSAVPEIPDAVLPLPKTLLAEPVARNGSRTGAGQRTVSGAVRSGSEKRSRSSAFDMPAA